MDWAAQAEAAVARHRDGESRLGDATDDDPRQQFQPVAFLVRNQHSQVLCVDVALIER